MAKNYRPLDDPNDHKFMEDFYLQNNRLIMDKVKRINSVQSKPMKHCAEYSV